MTQPGRLGDPSRTLANDPRTDPRLADAMSLYGLGEHPEPATVGPDTPLEELLPYFAAGESGADQWHVALSAGLPLIDGVTVSSTTIPGIDGNAITLYIHRPVAATAPLPAVVHLHGGGMTINSADDPVYDRWRSQLAATGLVVVGVEFRNAAGKRGPHPFPAGLNDCATAVQWTATHLGDLGASHVVVSGESGGGNLTLAVGLKAKREGWIDQIAGFYAQCPFISNHWHDQPDELPSLRENDGYFIACDECSALPAVYDPGSKNVDNPLCWPYLASAADLVGLPPHVISVNELDPLRDEGLSYFRRLNEAGVSAVGRTVAGTCHAGDVLLPAAIPNVHAATIRDISGFAHSLAPARGD